MLEKLLFSKTSPVTPSHIRKQLFQNLIFLLLPQELPHVLIQVSTDFKEMWQSVSISLFEKRY